MAGQVLIINVFMNRILLIAAVLFFCLSVKSQQQQEYFVFIQETSRQPFYVRMGEVSHSSSATGHIIVSNLRDSVYNFFIGFPKGRSREQLFAIRVNKKDHGYELKNMDGRWQLFDLQTLELINPAMAHRADGQTIMRSDSYSSLMSNVVDDSAVLYSAVEDTLNTDTVAIAAEVKAAADSAGQVKNTQPKQPQVPDTSITIRKSDKTVKNKQPKQPRVTDTTRTARTEDTTRTARTEDTTKMVRTADTTATVRTADTTATVQTADTTAVANTPPIQVPFVPQPSSGRDKRDIIRVITENIPEGKLMIYVDRTGPVSDTIRILIPRL